MHRYVIIGTGAAAIAAAEAIRKADPSGELLLIGDEREGYYSRPGLAYYLTGELPENQLFPLQETDFHKIRARRIFGRVVQLHRSAKQAELQDGSRIAYHRLLVATGAQAAWLDVPGNRLEGVVKLDNLQDARRILKLARKARSAVVVGGGITALELVEGLVARRVKVHYFLRGDRYWSNVLDETESAIVEHRLKEEGVQIHYHTELAEIFEKRGRVAAVRTTDGRRLACDLVGIAIGIRPRIQLAQSAGLSTERGILVNERLETSDPHIYAAGDVAQVFDPLTGRSVLDSLWGAARDQGTAAGLNMAGGSHDYRKPIAFNVTRLANLTTTIIGIVGGGQNRDMIGIARGDSEIWRQLPDAIAAQSDFDVNRLRIMVGERTLIGAIVMGDQTLSRPLHHLVLHQTDIRPIRDRLLQPHADIADVIAEFWASQNRKGGYAAQ